MMGRAMCRSPRPIPPVRVPLLHSRGSYRAATVKEWYLKTYECYRRITAPFLGRLVPVGLSHAVQLYRCGKSGHYCGGPESSDFCLLFPPARRVRLLPGFHLLSYPLGRSAPPTKLPFLPEFAARLSAISVNFPTSSAPN